jgi:formate hydrogenlyase subunit 3/multisubunit Na+/H+ antiporter MnhD subunit
MNLNDTPVYVLAIITAAWFGLMGYRNHSSAAMWGIAGAVLGLCVTCVCLGIANAATVPYAPPKIHRLRWDAIATAVVIIGVLGAVVGTISYRTYGAKRCR